MKDTAPKGQGVIAVAALFGIIAAGVAFVLFKFGVFGALLIGVIVAALAAIFLLFGWREAKPYTGAPDVPSASAPTAARPKVAEPAPTPTEAPAAAAVVAEPEPKQAIVKPSAPLAGQDALAAKKGEWKYEGEKTPSSAEDAPATTPEAPTAAADVPAGDAAAPEFLKEAREGGADDLKQIKGVGPKLEKTLHGMGIFHFDQISGWGAAEQAWMDNNLQGFKGRATRDDWVAQAKTLAAGGETDFSKKVEKGGVY